MIKELLEKLKSKPAKPGNATLAKMKVDATIVVRRHDGTLKSKRELIDNKEVLKEDY